MNDTDRQAAGRFRRGLLLSGLAGLMACGSLAVLCVGVVAGGVFPILLPYPPITLALVVILGAISLAEIPMMVYAMRQLVIEREGNYGPVQALNVIFCFFAGVYAAPVVLLTGSVGWGLALFGLALVRFASSLLFVRPPEKEPDGEENAT